MKPAHPVVISKFREITGHVRPMALANAIHSSSPSSWGGAFFITLHNIRDCIEAGDRWFEEETPEGFRISTDSGFSCILQERLAALEELLDSLRFAVARVRVANAEGDPILSAWLPGADAVIAKAGGRADVPKPLLGIGSHDAVLDALRRAERFMTGFESDPLQDGIDDDLEAIRAAIACLEDGIAASAALSEHAGGDQQ